MGAMDYTAQEHRMEKFTEPQGWALKWDEAGLNGYGVPAPIEQKPVGNGGVGEKFTEPQGWALKWDGFGLSGQQ